MGFFDDLGKGITGFFEKAAEPFNFVGDKIQEAAQKVGVGDLWKNLRGGMDFKSILNPVNTIQSKGANFLNFGKNLIADGKGAAVGGTLGALLGGPTGALMGINLGKAAEKGDLGAMAAPLLGGAVGGKIGALAGSVGGLGGAFRGESEKPSNESVEMLYASQRRLAGEAEAKRAEQTAQETKSAESQKAAAFTAAKSSPGRAITGEETMAFRDSLYSGNQETGFTAD